LSWITEVMGFALIDETEKAKEKDRMVWMNIF
jgi:hypothetical protein